MIPIDYVGDMKFYDDFINGFRGKLSELKEKGIGEEIGQYVNSSILITQEDKDFLDYLLDGTKLEDIAKKTAEDLSSIVTEIKSKFPTFALNKTKMKEAPLYKFVKYVFVSLGYEDKDFDKSQMIKAVGIDVCPYCNRSFVKNVSKKKGEPIKGELDHFYTKELYPYLVISKYNLVPCCHTCNGQSGKYRKDVMKHHIVNPYTLHDCNGIKVHAEISNSNILNLKKMAEAITITVEAEEETLKNNIETFHLQELYSSHADYAAELFAKFKLKRNKKYRHFVRGLMRGSNLGLSEADIERVIHGFYVEEKDFGKRPLSKFQYDIAKDLGII